MTDAAPVQKIVNLDDLPLDSLSRGTRFAAEFGEIGLTLGLKGLGAMLHVVPAGKTAFPFHRHHVSDEMFLVLSGTGTYRIGTDMLPIKAGDCLGAPAGGEAHQIINSGNEPLRYIGFSNNTNVDVIEHPDSGRLRIDAGASGYHHNDATFKEGGKLTHMDYWDGEDTGETT
jgi:uncharacterized cupin superfamily protein